MSSTVQSGFEFGRDIRLTRAEQTLAEAGAARSDVAPRTWIHQALIHYERWQDLWDYPMSTPEVHSHSAEVDLFATLVENAPECLRGKWWHLHDMVRLNAGLWVYPTQSVEDYESGREPCFPYLDRAALTKAWPQLMTIVDGVMTARLAAATVADATGLSHSGAD